MDVFLDDINSFGFAVASVVTPVLGGSSFVNRLGHGPSR